MNVNNRFWNWVFENKKITQKPTTKEIKSAKTEENLIQPMTHREVMLRYTSVWKTIFFFCIPTVVLMLVQGLYNILDKSLALQFATPHAVTNWKYLTLMIIGSGNGVDSLLLTEDAKKLFDLSRLSDSQWAEINSLLDKYKNGLLDDSGIMNALSKFKGVLAINKDLMKSYINIATQYTTQTYNLAYSFNQIMAIGAGMVFAIEFGKGNKTKLKEIAGNGLTFAIMMSLLVGVLLFSVSFKPWGQILISSQMGSHKNLIVEELAWKDVEPLIYGIFVLFMANFCMNMIRSEGKMIHIMIMTISSLGVKCIVSIVAMHWLGWELTGAQLGTVMAYLYQLVYALIVMFGSKVTYSRFALKDLYTLNWSNYFETLKAGIPNFVIYFAVFVNAYIATALVVQLPVPDGIPNTGNISIVQQLISSMTPWNEFILSAVIGLNQGVRTIIAFNYGAGNNRRILDVLKKSSWLMFGWFMFIFVLIIVAGPSMATLFAFPQEYISYGSTFYWYQFVYFMTYPLACFTYISLGLFQGTRRSKAATWATSLRTMVILLPLLAIGFGISKATNNAFWFFLFSGLTDLVVAFLLVPLLYVFYKRAKLANKIMTKEDSPEIRASYDMYLNNLQNKKTVKKNLVR